MAIYQQQPGLYYDDAAPNYGEYRKLSLREVIDSFNATYVGQGKICEGVLINDITFHAIRGLQELSYDTLRSEKSIEVIVPSTLTLVMPVDYVNYVKIAWSDGNGIERLLYPTDKTSNPRQITEVNTVTGVTGEAEAWGGFDTLSDNIDLSYDESATATSATADKYKAQTSNELSTLDADELVEYYGRLNGQRYGIDPQHAQLNGSFYIDEERGKIHFSSNVAGKTLVLKYISDGLVTGYGTTGYVLLNNSFIHKFAEEAIYKHILYGVLLARKDTPAGLLAQIKKERFAETRKAKIRLSNYKTEELTQVLRGGSKQIKH